MVLVVGELRSVVEVVEVAWCRARGRVVLAWTEALPQAARSSPALAMADATATRRVRRMDGLTDDAKAPLVHRA